MTGSPSEVIPFLQLAFVDVLRERRLDDEARGVAAGRLLDMARRTEWPELACRALERVIGWEVEGRTEHVDPVNVRLTEMIRRRDDPCPRCLRPLPDARTLELKRFESEAAAWERRLGEQMAS